MSTTLHITNGDSSLAIMRKAGVTGPILPWRDVLHEGPVPEGLTLEELSLVRAQYIADCGWGTYENIQKDFTERDKELTHSSQYDRVTLWFEHDLYDQLQIMQILDWYNHHNASIPLSLICTDQYLGHLSPEEMGAMVKYEQELTAAHLTLATSVWRAFRAPTPEQLLSLLTTDTSLFPFLHDAILRLLEEYPHLDNGLSRTAKQALASVNNGIQKVGKVFGENQKHEQRVFMGDLSFFAILNELLTSSPPLLQLSGAQHPITPPVTPAMELSITETGKAVLAGTHQWLDCITIDKWIGGVHLTAENLWCWNAADTVITRQDQ